MTNIPTCWICGRAIPLEQSKIDEHGRAVHEDCYLARVKLEQSPNIPQSGGPATQR